MEQFVFYNASVDPKDVGRLADGVDPDQFAQTNMSQYIEYVQYVSVFIP